MKTFTSIEAAALAADHPVICRFNAVHAAGAPREPLSPERSWLCKLLADKLKSLYSLLSVGGDHRELLLTSMLAIHAGVPPRRLICVCPDGSSEERQRIHALAKEHRVPEPNVLCGDPLHRATFFQAQEFGPYDVLFSGLPLSGAPRPPWGELVRDGGFLVIDDQAHDALISALVPSWFKVGRVTARRKP